MEIECAGTEVGLDSRRRQPRYRRKNHNGAWTATALSGRASPKNWTNSALWLRKNALFPPRIRTATRKPIVQQHHKMIATLQQPTSRRQNGRSPNTRTIDNKPAWAMTLPARTSTLNTPQSFELTASAIGRIAKLPPTKTMGS